MFEMEQLYYTKIKFFKNNIWSQDDTNGYGKTYVYISKKVFIYYKQLDAIQSITIYVILKIINKMILLTPMNWLQAFVSLVKKLLDELMVPII